MPTIISGSRATAATLGINADRRVVEMHPRVMQLDPDAAPLVIFTSMLNKRSVGNPVFKTLEDEKVPTIDRVNNSGGYTASATSVTVDNGGYFGVNTLVRVQRTNEVMLVTAIATNALTVTRSFGGTAAAALLDNDQLQILGGAAIEGTTAELSRTTKTSTNTNYCQIFRWPFDLTNTDIESNVYGEKELSYQQRKGLVEIKSVIEMAFLWGEAIENTGGNTPRRSTGGIDNFISTNATNFGGGFNLPTFYSAMEDLMRHGSQSKLLFVGRSVNSNISLEAINHLEVTSKEKSFGMSIKSLETPHGRALIKPHPLMEGDTYKKYGLVVDAANVGFRSLTNRDVKLKTNVQANDADKRTDEYVGEVGLWRSLEKTHGRFTNAA